MPCYWYSNVHQMPRQGPAVPSSATLEPHPDDELRFGSDSIRLTTVAAARCGLRACIRIIVSRKSGPIGRRVVETVYNAYVQRDMTPPEDLSDLECVRVMHMLKGVVKLRRDVIKDTASSCLPWNAPEQARESLVSMIDYVLDRLIPEELARADR